MSLRRTCELFHGFGVVIQLALFAHLGLECALKALKGELALGVEELGFDVLLLLIEIGLIGLLVIGDAIDDPIGAEENGIAGLADGQTESAGILFHTARAGDGSVARYLIAGFY